MNILTFDIEEWYIEKMYNGGREKQYRQYDAYFARILELLDRHNIKATFFCVGGMATDFPNVVRQIAAKGHEVGCHSNIHQWLNKMTPKEALEDTRMAVDALEQLIGQKVTSYRAPAFSIGESNKWAFEILAECGIERDASVFPASRDFGGFPQFKSHEPTVISFQGITMKEFPIPTARLFGKELAYSGGGYFRFFPLWFIKNCMKRSRYNMCYFHIGDLIPEHGGVMSKDEYESYFKAPGTLKNRYMRYIKSNLGKETAFKKMSSLISTTDFVNVEAAELMVDWGNTVVINLD